MSVAAHHFNKLAIDALDEDFVLVVDVLPAEGPVFLLYGPENWSDIIASEAQITQITNHEPRITNYDTSAH